MKIYSVMDPEFKLYGRVVEGVDTAGLLAALATTPVTDGVVYIPKVDVLHAAAGAEAAGDIMYGGMPYQLGICNGHNTKLNCLEYHRDSEFNLGVQDFILLLAKQEEIGDDGLLDTAKVKAFRCPAGTLIEVYATTMHYAPCHVDAEAGFQVMIGLPALTNTDYRPGTKPNTDDARLWARNKWLLAHKDTSEAADGAVIGLVGENIDIAADL